jgi:hypothetical protein
MLFNVGFKFVRLRGIRKREKETRKHHVLLIISVKSDISLRLHDLREITKTIASKSFCCVNRETIKLAPPTIQFLCSFIFITRGKLDFSNRLFQTLSRHVRLRRIFCLSLQLRNSRYLSISISRSSHSRHGTCCYG